MRLKQQFIMKASVSALSLVATATVFLSCSNENGLVEVQRTSIVDARLVEYFQSFEYEASLRGVEIDYDAFPVFGHIRNIQEADIAGTCSYDSHNPNVVTIDLEYWNAASPSRREMVVFHELGHCVLGRGHLETAFANGICATVMNSGTSGCVVAYNNQNRDYYLDELFGK